MDHPTPPPAPVPYTPAPFTPPPPPGRPGLVTAVALLGVLWGLVFGLGLPALIWPLLHSATVDSPAVAEIRKEPILLNFTILSLPAGVIAMMLLLIGSLGALATKPWGRRFMLYYAVIELLLLAAIGFMAYRLFSVTRNDPGALRLTIAVVAARAVFALVVLLVMNARGAKAAFAPRAAGTT